MLFSNISTKLKKGLERRIYSLHPRSFKYNFHCRKFPDKPIRVTIDHSIQARVWPGDVIGKSLYVRGFFEKEENLYISRILRPGMIFFDVGANMGFYTLLAAKRLGSTGQVHSFEPSPRMFRELKFNTKLNGYTNIKANQIALGDYSGKASLSRYPSGQEVYSSLSKRTFPGADITGYDDVIVETLDNYIISNKIRQVDIVKMDVEGAELKVLQGAKSFLLRCKPEKIIFELAEINALGFGYKCREVLDLLRSQKYKIYIINAGGKLTSVEKNPLAYPGSPSFVAKK